MEPKPAKEPSKTPFAQQGQKRVPKGWVRCRLLGTIFEPPIHKHPQNTIQKIFKNLSQKNMKSDSKTMSKGHQKLWMFQFVCERVNLGNCWFYFRNT